MEPSRRFSRRIHNAGPLLIPALLASVFIATIPIRAQQQPQPSDNPSQGSYSIKTSVRRVVVDVVVTDAQGNSKRGLAAKDFSIEEDNQTQRILSFDSHDKDSYPGVLPANVPPNTFINLPREPEQGPLYILLYDMVNTGDTNPIGADYSANIFARQQLIKFVNGKPSGTRFALIVNSDGLHLVQGFTNDKQKLLTALDPNGKTPHMPKVFLYTSNYRPGDPYYILAVLKDIEQYVEGLPGRKNVIWASLHFPFALFPSNSPPDVIDPFRKQLTEMAANQIAIYPVSAGGSPIVAGGAERWTMDEIAAETGGFAYQSNDMAGDIERATERGDTYYTLSYTSTNKDYNGKLRHIEVKLSQQGYHLAYRHEYYADPELPQLPTPPGAPKPKQINIKDAPTDTLYAYLRFGAPMSHDLLFSAHVQPVGDPKLATPEQMADLSDQPAYFRKRHKDKPVDTRPPVPLQAYSIEYDIPSRQFRANPATRDQPEDPIEFAAAAYTAEGVMLNGKIGNASPKAEQTKYYPAQQEFEVPTNAARLCLAVRDPTTGRIGNLEINLPLQPDPTK